MKYLRNIPVNMLHFQRPYAVCATLTKPLKWNWEFVVISNTCKHRATQDIEPRQEVFSRGLPRSISLASPSFQFEHYWSLYHNVRAEGFWLPRDRGNSYLTSLPLVRVRRHGRVKVEMKFHLESKLHFPSTQLMLRRMRLTNVSESIQDKHWVSWLSFDV